MRSALLATKRRSGFTLAEVLVTLAIIAVLAAVLLPALNSQIGKGDAGRLAEDLKGIQAGSQAFYSDVHRYPSDISHLTTAITASQTDILGVAYPSMFVARWKGPYITKDVVSPTSVGTISGAFTRSAGANGINYVTVSIASVSASDFEKIENGLDEGTTSSTSSTTGLVRWSSTTSILTYLMLPIQ